MVQKRPILNEDEDSFLHTWTKIPRKNSIDDDACVECEDGSFETLRTV